MPRACSQSKQIAQRFTNSQCMNVAKIALFNGEEVTVNRALDGSMYPS